MEIKKFEYLLNEKSFLDETKSVFNNCFPFSSFGEKMTSFKLTILIFWTKLAQKRYFWSKNRKSEHYHWIKHIRISPCTKFHFKQIILKFRPKFAQKGYFWLKTQKVNVIIELLWVPNFSLNGQFRFLEPNLPIKAISGLK